MFRVCSAVFASCPFWDLVLTKDDDVHSPGPIQGNIGGTRLPFFPTFLLLPKTSGGVLDVRQCRTLMVFQPAEARMIDITFPSRFVRVTYFVHNDREGRILPSGARMISKHHPFLEHSTQISSVINPFSDPRSS